MYEHNGGSFCDAYTNCSLEMRALEVEMNWASFLLQTSSASFLCNQSDNQEILTTEENRIDGEEGEKDY